MSFALRLKAAREKSQKSLQQLADEVGASKAHIWELEIGKSKNPSLDLITKLARALNLTVAHLAGEVPSELSENPEVAMAMFRDLSALDPADQEIIVALMEKFREKKQASGDGNN